MPQRPVRVFGSFADYSAKPSSRCELRVAGTPTSSRQMRVAVLVPGVVRALRM